MRYTTIAMRNDATHKFISGEPSLDLANQLGLEVFTKTWQDAWTNAAGRYFAVRTRHLKKLPRSIRKQLKAGV
jgi:hypothetical protein